jgi:hypothetical protein
VFGASNQCSARPKTPATASTSTAASVISSDGGCAGDGENNQEERKLEIRMSKSETISNDWKIIKIKERASSVSPHFSHFGFVSDFDIRISDFGRCEQSLSELTIQWRDGAPT